MLKELQLFSGNIEKHSISIHFLLTKFAIYVTFFSCMPLCFVLLGNLHKRKTCVSESMSSVFL